MKVQPGKQGAQEANEVGPSCGQDPHIPVFWGSCCAPGSVLEFQPLPSRTSFLPVLFLKAKNFFSVVAKFKCNQNNSGSSGDGMGELGLP